MVYTQISQRFRVNHLTVKLSNWIFTHLKLCVADAIHNLKKVILFYVYISQNL